MMPHSALTPGSVAVVTRGAAGIGLAAAIQPGSGIFGPAGNREQVLGVNLWVENRRPPFSRWHPDYADAFKAFSRKRS